MARYAVAGCKISIGPVVADKDVDFVAADFTALTPYVEINEWTTMGDFGDESADIASQIIGIARDKHAKGTRNAAQVVNVHNNDPLNAGQIAVKAAAATTFNYAIKVELNDKPAVGAAPKNGLIYFIALINSAKHIGGSANTNRGLNVTMQPNSNFVEIAASAT